MPTFGMARRRLIVALAAMVACLTAACTPSQYEFESNKRLGVHLKVPKGWQEVPQDALFPLYEQSTKQGSPEAYRILKQVVWEKAWDSSPNPAVGHFVLGSADAPVARVMVRSLLEEEQKAISPEYVANLAVGSYSEDVQGFKELLRNPGTSELVSADFIPLQDEQLSPDGYFGVRQLFEARNPEDESLYVVAFIGLVDVERTRLYTLTMHCNRRCFLANESLFSKVLDSFTVRKP